MSQPAVWDPSQYHQYGDLRPALELLSRVSAKAPSIVHDIGTGGGEIARLMAERWPNARVIGSDSSREMLDKAAEADSSVEWRFLDLGDWKPAAEHDVTYGNAVLHWLPDHAELLPLLRPLTSALDIWETTYQQILTGADPVFEWVSGSILRPVLTQLPAADAANFSDRCRRSLREAYPPQPDGTTLFPFRRLFIVARR